MCGIFGVISGENTALLPEDVRKLTDKLFKLSESRGKEASGLTLIPSTHSDRLVVVKSPGPASNLIRNKEYREVFDDAFRANGGKMVGVAFGHTRLVTNGSQLNEGNNQPVVYEGTVGVHNGIIVNVDELWKKHSDLNRGSDVDTEVLLALIRKYYRETKSPETAVRKVFAEIRGTASVAVTFSDLNILILATNNGSLYVATGKPNQPIYFASEKFTLDQLLKSSLGFDFSAYTVRHIHSNEGAIVNLQDQSQHEFEFAANGDDWLVEPITPSRSIRTFSIGTGSSAHSVMEIKRASVPKKLLEESQRLETAVQSLKRCTKCVLPETVPFIEFNSSGVCNFCTNYKKLELLGKPALEAALAPFRKPGKEADCVAAFSGGRDSCYGLHYLVKEMGMKPVAYTYDWGMVTDLARRNISRMCSALGVEHILISADIPWKRENIRMNVSAWLKKPHMGMIPLFMAGDKQFVWYSYRVKKQTGLDLDIFTFNLMEKTPFKEEYSGIQFWKPGADADKLGEDLGLVRGVKLCAFYGKEFLTNPGYWNRSLLDTFYGFVAYYLLPRNFVQMFRYIPWDEEVISRTLIDGYDWELSPDTQSTWRIGDGTASFYNYIYHTVGGFTENDTFRSNQIREGQLTREAALKLVERDNRPRWDSFKWYCDIIGIDFERTVETINKINKTHPALR